MVATRIRNPQGLKPDLAQAVNVGAKAPTLEKKNRRSQGFVVADLLEPSLQRQRRENQRTRTQKRRVRHPVKRGVSLWRAPKKRDSSLPFGMECGPVQLSSESFETPEAAIQGPGAARAVPFKAAIRSRMMVPKQGEGTCSLA